MQNNQIEAKAKQRLELGNSNQLFYHNTYFNIGENEMIKWEKLNNNWPNCSTYRAKVLGGWLVTAGDGLTFYPDPEHKWDGSTLD